MENHTLGSSNRFRREIRSNQSDYRDVNWDNWDEVQDLINGIE